jgi:hypothetical protein
MLSFRASEEEIARVKELAAKVIEQNPFATEADVLRNLVGLDNRLKITKEMRARLLPVTPSNTIKDRDEPEHIRPVRAGKDQ